MWTGPSSVMVASLTRHDPYSILIKSIDFLLCTKYAIHDLYPYDVLGTQTDCTLGTIVIVISVDMQFLMAFLARHGLHTSLNFAFWADREPISFPAILVCLLVLFSIPLSNLTTERAVIFVGVSKYLLLPFFPNLLFICSLVVSTQLSHHHAINALLFEAFLALGVIIAPDDNFIDLFIASKALNSGFDSFKYIARSIGINLFPFVVYAFQRPLAFLNDLIALNILKIILLLKHNLLRINIYPNKFDLVWLETGLLITKHAEVCFRVFLLNFVENVAVRRDPLSLLHRHLLEATRVALKVG